MRKLIRRYREMSNGQKTVIITVISLCFSAVLAASKLIIGLFSDYDLCGVAVYSIAILIAKLECILGIKSKKLTFRQRNALIAGFLLFSSLIYVGFMCRLFFIERTVKSHSIVYVTALAFISFAELGFAIAGLVRANIKEHFYRYIKIINFGIALIAILTTQITILDFMSESADVYSAYAGIGVGSFIAICAVYILFAPKISVIGREYNQFILTDESKNTLSMPPLGNVEVMLTPSRVYGSYVYAAYIENGKIDGKIERKQSLWKRMHILLKILCYVLSEILIFVWLFGRILFFLRTINLPKRLEKKMNKNGFEKISDS